MSGIAAVMRQISGSHFFPFTGFSEMREFVSLLSKDLTVQRKRFGHSKCFYQIQSTPELYFYAELSMDVSSTPSSRLYSSSRALLSRTCAT